MKFVTALLVVDAPVLLATLVAGSVYGYANTFHAVSDFRTDHWWTFLPSVAVAIVVVRRWRTR